MEKLNIYNNIKLTNSKPKRKNPDEISGEEYKYYKNNLLEQLVNKEPDGTDMDIYEYQYDSAGNQTSKTEKIDGTVKGTTTYTYDDLNRLESVTEPDERCTEYTYDKSDN